MKIYIGADHRGFELRKRIVKSLQEQGYLIVDVGIHQNTTSCDYPKVSYKVATAVAKDPKARGILVCMSGIGHSIAANKVPGVYAALCYNKQAAILSRQHNNANVLILGSKFVKEKEMMGIINVWLNTEFEGGRHLRRFKQIQKIEKKI